MWWILALFLACGEASDSLDSPSDSSSDSAGIDTNEASNLKFLGERMECTDGHYIIPVDEDLVDYPIITMCGLEGEYVRCKPYEWYFMPDYPDIPPQIDIPCDEDYHVYVRWLHG